MEVSPNEVFRMALRKFWIVVVGCVVGVAVGGLIWNFMPKDYYSTVTGYVTVSVAGKKNDGLNAANMANNISKQKAVIYATLFTDAAILDEVSKQFNLDGGVDELRSRVQVSVTKDTPNIKLVTGAGTEAEARSLGDALFSAVAKKAAELEGKDSIISLVVVASASESPVQVSPGVKRFLLMSIGCGFGAGLLSVLVCLQAVIRKQARSIAGHPIVNLGQGSDQLAKLVLEARQLKGSDVNTVSLVLGSSRRVKANKFDNLLSGLSSHDKRLLLVDLSVMSPFRDLVTPQSNKEVIDHFTVGSSIHKIEIRDNVDYVPMGTEVLLRGSYFTSSVFKKELDALTSQYTVLLCCCLSDSLQIAPAMFDFGDLSMLWSSKYLMDGSIVLGEATVRNVVRDADVYLV